MSVVVMVSTLVGCGNSPPTVVVKAMQMFSSRQKLMVMMGSVEPITQPGGVVSAP